MVKRTVIGSSLSAVILAALLYFIVYFFVPTIADPFFGISYQGKRDVDQLKTSVTDILEKARVPQVEIDQYVAQFDTQDFYQQLHNRSVQGEEAILDYLDSLKTGVDFSSFESSELKTVLADGFAQTSRFTQNQLRALERILKGTLDSL